MRDTRLLSDTPFDMLRCVRQPKIIGFFLLLTGTLFFSGKTYATPLPPGGIYKINEAIQFEYKEGESFVISYAGDTYESVGSGVIDIYFEIQRTGDTVIYTPRGTGTHSFYFATNPPTTSDIIVSYEDGSLDPEHLDKDDPCIRKGSGNFYQCYAELAVSRNDELVCKRSEPYSSHCFAVMALHKQDESICDIADVGSQKHCYEELAPQMADIVLCDKLEGQEWETRRQRCYMAVASNNKDQEICSRISTPRIREECLYAVATGEGNDGICEYFDSPEASAGCFIGVAAAKGDAKICEQHMPTKALRDFCNLQTAFARANSTYCMHLSTEAKKSLCKKYVETGIGSEISLTRQMTCPNRINDSCLIKVAKKMQEPSVCELSTNMQAHATRKGMTASEWCEVQIPGTKKWLFLLLKVMAILIPLALVFAWEAFRGNTKKALIVGAVVGIIIGITPTNCYYFLCPQHWAVLPFFFLTNILFEIEIPSEIQHMYIFTANVIMFGLGFNYIAKKKIVYIFLGALLLLAGPILMFVLANM